MTYPVENFPFHVDFEQIPQPVFHLPVALLQRRCRSPITLRTISPAFFQHLHRRLKHTAETHKTASTSVADWARTDLYHNSFLIKPDASIDGAQKHSAAEGLPDIAVSAAQGKFLKLLAQSIGAKRVIEVGVLGGYSTIWLAQAVGENGEVIGFELNEHHAKASLLSPIRLYERLSSCRCSFTSQVARENIAHAGFEKIVKVVVGPTIDGLKALRPKTPFDLVFIDADKESCLEYFIEAKRLVRKGGIIVSRHALTPVFSDNYV